MYSISIGDNFNIPQLTAYDNYNDDIGVTYTHNINFNQIGSYKITYKATNEIGTTTLEIIVNVVSHEYKPMIVLESEVPETYFTNQKLILPDAIGYDYYGNQLLVTKSVEEVTMYHEGDFIVEYFTEDQYGNSTTIKFVINFIENPDYENLPIELTNYYQSAIGLKGYALQLELYNIVSKRKLISYNTTSVPLSNIDRDINQTDKVYLIYNGAKVNYAWDSGNTWNKEHVWPKSKLGIPSWSNSHTGIGSDMHNLRAANPSINSTRGNKPFQDSSGTYKAVGSGWYPGDNHIGDVARIILYMHVAWDYEINIGSRQMFLKWHQMDPVDEFEIARNNRIYEYQNNRNPFIDYPDFAVDIWGQVAINNNKVVVTIFMVNEYYDFSNKESLYKI